MNDDVISHIRSRVERCRYLASVITDQKAAGILRQMAEDGEADIKRMEAQRSRRSVEQRPSADDQELS